MRTSKKPIYDLLSDLHAINVLNVNLNFSSSFRCYRTLLGAVSLALCVCVNALSSSFSICMYFEHPMLRRAKHLQIHRSSLCSLLYSANAEY